MTTEGIKRKLVAILSADAKGYSRLMGEDEKATVETIKNKPVKIKQISEELGVQYIIEGSVRRVGQQVRINAQLIDATKGHHLWAERYDGSLKDIFALQDRITQKIVTALTVKLSGSESGLITQQDTDKIEAYDAYLKASDFHIRWTREDTQKAVIYYQKAIEIDPEYSRAYASLGSLILDAPAGWTGIEIPVFIKLIPEYIEKAMNKPNPQAYVFSATIKKSLHLPSEAIQELRNASRFFPNEPAILNALASALIFAGKPKEAVVFAERAMRLDPRFIAVSLRNIGIAYYAIGDSEKAVSYLQRSLDHNPEFRWNLLFITAAYAHLDRIREAREALNKFSPDKKRIPLRLIMPVLWGNDVPELNEFHANNLLKAGVQGEPGGYYKIYEKNRILGKEIKELLQDTKDFEYRIENNMLCAKWIYFGDCCRPIFRNPEGTPEENNQYFLESYEVVSLFSTADDLAKLVETKSKKKRPLVLMP